MIPSRGEIPPAIEDGRRGRDAIHIDELDRAPFRVRDEASSHGYNERMTTKLRVHFDGSVLVPEEAVDLPIGQSVEIQVGPATQESIAVPGTPSAVLMAALAEPHVSDDDVAELERTIADAKLPAGNGVDFDRDAQ